MKAISGVGATHVQAVYGGPLGELWELLLGEQTHAGGMAASQELAVRAEIGADMKGVDLGCGSGAGMRFLVKVRRVAAMRGVDGCERAVKRGQWRNQQMGLDEQIHFTLGDMCDSHLPPAAADFVWGEDAWRHATDKAKLIGEAARLVKKNGAIAFTDWMEGPVALSDAEAHRALNFMKCPSLESLDGYRRRLEEAGCEVSAAEDTNGLAPCLALCAEAIERQMAFDALRILNFDARLLEVVTGEIRFLCDMAAAGKIIQGRIMARKTR